MNDVGEPCAGERHARFDRGPLAHTAQRMQGNDEKASAQRLPPQQGGKASGLPHYAALQNVSSSVLRGLVTLGGTTWEMAKESA